MIEAEKLRKALDEWLTRQAKGRSVRANSILAPTLKVYGQVRELEFAGDPDKDWRAVRRVMENGACSRLQELAAETRNVHLLERGTQLRQELSEDWRDNQAYRNALTITRQAFVQEHFSLSTKPETGVVVMNMHKAKGKQFDEVIVFEGWPKVIRGKIMANSDRIVRGNSPKGIRDQDRQNFRVSVTRAKQRTTILSPKNDPCVLLVAP